MSGGAVYTPLVSVTQTGAETFVTATSTATFSAQGIGAAPGGGNRRFVVAEVSGGVFGAASSPLITIAGNTATKVAEMNYLTSKTSYACIAIYEIPTGTTADIVASGWGVSMAFVGLATYSIITGPSGIRVASSGTDSDVSPWSIPLVGFTGGVIMGCAGAYNGSGAVSFVWGGTSGVVEDYDAAAGATDQGHSGASILLTGSGTKTVTGVGTNTVDDTSVVAASFIGV